MSKTLDPGIYRIYAGMGRYEFALDLIEAGQSPVVLYENDRSMKSQEWALAWSESSQGWLITNVQTNRPLWCGPDAPDWQVMSGGVDPRWNYWRTYLAAREHPRSRPESNSGLQIRHYGIQLKFPGIDNVEVMYDDPKQLARIYAKEGLKNSGFDFEFIRASGV